MRKRDTQRSRVYRAELCLSREENRFSSIAEVADWVQSIQTSQWWKKNHPGFLTPILVRHKSHGAATGGGRLIRLPKWGWTQSVILHEIAHCVTPSSRHCWEFCDAYLKLVRRWMGIDAHDRLRKSFKTHRVRFSPKRKLSPEHKAKLVAQLVKARKKLTPKVKQEKTALELLTKPQRRVVEALAKVPGSYVEEYQQDAIRWALPCNTGVRSWIHLGTFCFLTKNKWITEESDGKTRKWVLNPNRIGEIRQAACN